MVCRRPGLVPHVEQTMTQIFGVPIQAMLGQLLIGLQNGAFYAVLSLGLAVIFGLLNIINFAHGALFMMGAFGAWMGVAYGAQYLGFEINYWAVLIIVPLIIGAIGV